MLERLLVAVQPMFLCCCAAVLTVPPLYGQTTAPNADAPLTLKANSRIVVLDVVVTGKNGKPVTGLTKEDFTLTEDGHPEKVVSFETHTGDHALPTSLPTLPPNVFTNIPRVTLTDSVTVLLLDSLNTPLQDQARVHTEILKYLKEMEPGRRIAIFGLNSQLHFIQGFTADPALLAAALNDPKNGSGPQSSNVLSSRTEDAASQSALASIGIGDASTATADSLKALTGFLAQQKAAQTDQRVRMTLDALQQLGRYLAAIPGRKNVVWFSSVFPLSLAPDPDLDDSFGLGHEYEADVKQTDDLLTGAEVAIYPVAAEGLATLGYYGADQRPVGVHGGYDAIQQQNKAILNESIQRNSAQATMESIAQDTGGEAIYNTNGLKEALAKVVDHGTNFYTITYTPTNTATDGRYRKMRVKVTGSGYTLAYRRGYFAVDGKVLQAVKKAGEPLQRFMGLGMPDSTQIPIALRVQRVPSAGAGGGNRSTEGIAGDNGKIVKLKGPLTRYAVDFVIAARGLQLDPAANGGRLGRINATVVIYDQDGNALNWKVRQVDLDMDDARYAQVEANGVNFQLEVDVPKSGAFLRGGIYDQRSTRTGTLEIPLSRVITDLGSASVPSR